MFYDIHTETTLMYQHSNGEPCVGAPVDADIASYFPVRRLRNGLYGIVYILNKMYTEYTKQTNPISAFRVLGSLLAP